jgi:hypothetical protein
MNWIRKDRHGKINYSFSKWASWIFLVASIMLLIYTYYRSEIVFQGALDFVYFKYYLISLSGIFFWVVVLCVREVIRANIVTLILSLVVGLYIIEGILTFYKVGQSNYQTRAAELGVNYDLRTKIEVIEDLLAEGVDAVPAVRPRDVLTMDKKLLPIGGVSHKTTVGENENGSRMIYLSDRYGFNNPDSEWDASEVKWLLTGDSFTEGVAVKPGEDIAGQLRIITKESAINIGRSGNGPLMELAELTEYAEAIKPKIVLWVYYRNDLISEKYHMNDLQRDKKNPILIQYMEDGFSQNLINRQEEIDNSLEKYILLEKAQSKLLEESQKDVPKQSQLFKSRWVRLYAIRSMIGFDDDVDVDYSLFSKILTKAKSKVESWGGKLYFVYLPEYGLYSNKLISYDNFNKKAEVLQVVNELDIPVIDVFQEIIKNQSDPFALFPFRLPGHYNSDGYREIAKAIVSIVSKYEHSNK